MKKFWMISMLLIAALFFVSCGGDDEGGDGGNGGNGGNNDNACTTQGAFRCNGDMLQKCDQEEWKNFEQCSAEKPCNAETGKCEPKSTDTTDTTDTDTDTTDTDTTPDNTDTGTNQGGDAKEACYDIYACFAQCQDNDCANACVQNGDPAGQSVFMEMYNCWNNNCANETTNEGFTNCVETNCRNETAACGLMGEEGNTAYSAPYGHVDININATYIITNETQLDQSMVNMSYFATGTFGTNGTTQPMGAQGAYYYAMLDSNMVQIAQTPFANNGQTALNPAVFLVIGADVAPGNITVGLTQDDAAQLFVVDLNGNNIGCYHAFAVGTLTVNTMNVAAGSAGNIAIVGSQLELYSTENAPMYGGNITSQMGQGFSACPAQ